MVRDLAEKTKVEQLRKRMIKKARKEVKEAYTGKDVHVIKAANLLGDLDNVFNLLAEQLREWYGVHFPELERIVRDNDAYLKLVYSLGMRGNFDAKSVAEHYSGERASEIVDAVKKSIGADLGTAELGEIKLLALNALNIKEERTYIGKYVEKEMSALAPNFSELAGAILAARLLAKAGSLRKLAIVPSSTMQVYGAERALFQAMKRGSRGPKYGLIFGHPMVASAKPHLRGKVARALAGKLSIAAREDYFGKEKIAARLRKELDARVNAIAGMGPGKKATVEEMPKQAGAGRTGRHAGKGPQRKCMAKRSGMKKEYRQRGR